MSERRDPNEQRLADGWRTVSEAADLLGLHRGGVRAAMDRGLLPYSHIAHLVVVHVDDIEVYRTQHRGGRGRPHGVALLPAETVRAIRADVAAGSSRGAAARKYHVSSSYASRVVAEKVRRDVT